MSAAARILIVDDNLQNAKLAARILEFSGCTVNVAENAEEAQILLQSSRVDLILMDVGMPGMDGLTLTRKLKAENRFRHIPVIALTAFAMKGDEATAYEAGCNGYIVKPINTRTFAEQVLSYLKPAEKSEGGGEPTRGE